MASLTSYSAPYNHLFSNDKPAIPVIRNVTRNDELVKFKDGLKMLPPVSNTNGTHLVKVLKLMTNKHSENLVSRHSRAINNLSSTYTYGIHLKDVKIMLEIIKKCHDYISFDSLYEDLLCLLVNILSKPFLKSKVSDEEAYFFEVSECLSQLGSLAEVSSDKVKVTVSSSVSSLYSSIEQTHLFSDCRPSTTSFIKSVVEKSSICKSLGECLTQVSDFENRYSLMKCLNNLSDSHVNCNSMLKADVAACICNNLNFDMHFYKLLFVSMETLWNILDNGCCEEVARQFTSESSLKSLQSVFVNQMNQCTSYAERQLRNDILIIISLVVAKHPLVPLVECGLTKMISTHAIHPELPTNDAVISQIKLKRSPEDFELKKIFFNLIAMLCDNPLSIDVMSLHQVMLGIFSYVTPMKESLQTIWTLAEFEELQLQSMAVLSKLAPLCINDYMTFQGNARLLNMLDWCVSTNEFTGQGNSYYGYGGQGNKRAQMRLCIRFIRDMAATGDEEVCQDLSDQGLIDQLVAILSSCSNSLHTNDAVDIDIQCDMLFILASLCEDDEHRKSLFGENGVKMILRYVDGYMKIMKGPLSHHRLILSAIDCLCSSVLGYYMNEIDLLKREGAFMLLDMLDMCPENMKNVVLGTIADLVENDNTKPHLMLWRGRNAKTVSKMLIDTWVEEEKSLCVFRETYGVIGDPSHPLLTNYQEKQGIHAVPSTYHTPAIIDVSDNLRSKIYGIFCKLGFNNIPGLTSADYITLSIIEKYLDFKNLEIWQEIKKELKIENIEAVSPDKEVIDEIIMILQSKALTVKVIQHALIESNFEHAIIDEQDFYKKIKETYKQEEKVYQDFINYIDRTSDYTILKDVKMKQMKSIGCSRMLTKRPKVQHEKVLVHETMDPLLQTTTFCGRHLLVQSTNFNSTNLNGAMKPHHKVLSKLLVD